MEKQSLNKIAFIGAGNMAKSITIGLVNSGVPAKNIIVANPSPEKRLALAKEFGIEQTANNIDAVEFADIIVLSVKPHFIEQVCQDISEKINIKNKLFLSVAAGTTIAQIQSALNAKASVVRTMPNTPSQLGLGMSGLFASKEVNQAEKAAANKLMSAVGEVIWVTSEDKINEITAVAGSGPAYFFLFMEAMQKQAQEFGFTEQESRLLVQQTALGAAQMVEHNPIPISQLRENVTSKGGTTFAALETFRQQGLEQIVANSMQAALTRAQEMAKSTN
ncbi:pyrroline-5-carboxylate reductase [Litorilituus lipolyticus]|uniref:Pyrroline-5-carboxylate reductase n=1 Tax=Litorilituus lipolyticus TaxID=2491017 RepID=A0A502KYH8_9GAMM|nr:pyrroline-5-carboxylate reductase [Litorilituus lipolyticus]TPH16738.1 pyrroline-5-carboxylate reductase [Litorilituus lipolyticus]